MNSINLDIGPGRATIDRFEGDKAVIKTDDGQELIWPKTDLPADVKEGGAIRIKIQTDKTEELDKEDHAKAILNEILKTE